MPRPTPLPEKGPFDVFLRRTLGLVLFFLGRNLADFLVLAGLALAVSLLGIIPRGLRWFRLREEPSMKSYGPSRA